MSKSDSTFFIKRNDTAPNLIATVYDKGCLGEWSRLSLSGVTNVNFSMSNSNGVLFISSEPADIISVDSGIIQYSWKSGDTSVSGDYFGEFEIFFSDGKKMTLPRQGNIRIKILNDINSI